jgi:small multidrug resistance pump
MGEAFCEMQPPLENGGFFEVLSKSRRKKMAYSYLAIAIIAEVIATSALKASEQFTKLIPSLVVIIGYGAAFYFLTHVLKTIPVGVTYALWSGLGIVLITIAGVFLYKQTPDLPAILGMGLIVAGVVVINVFSNTVGH